MSTEQQTQEGRHATKVVDDWPKGYSLRCTCGWASKGTWKSVEGVQAAARMHDRDGTDPEAWVNS